MPLFNTVAPQETLTAPRTLSNDPSLGVLGYNSDGSQNTWGKILSWIPGVGIATDALAQNAAKGTDSAGQIEGYQKGNIDKLLLEGQIAATVIGGLAAGGASAGSVGADSAAGGGVGANPFSFAENAIQPSTGLSSASSSDAINGVSNVANSLNGGGNNWMSYVQKATKLVGKGSPLSDLTSGTDNNNYQPIRHSSVIQNYNY